jgi:hypothetical protein
VLRFIQGVRHPAIFAALELYGFTAGELETGWTRLYDFATLSYAKLGAALADPSTVQAIDEFENEWFPISQATLEHHYPEVAEKLFLNLSQTSGPEVAVSAGIFLRRLRQMERGAGEFAEEGRAARALLAERGLTEDVVANAEHLVGLMSKVAEQPQRRTPSAEEVRQAEDVMWAWYLEWSKIARTVIKDRRHLRMLGFLSARGGGLVEDDTVVQEAEFEEVEPDDEEAQGPFRYLADRGRDIRLREPDRQHAFDFALRLTGHSLEQLGMVLGGQAIAQKLESG